ncbi:MAG TPA: substrate-binding domain-containing protein [Casimicrobiaceae bacterium]|nr:substrate-binding domain-containing protein [Casimicrobiaceae bacterium]
MPVVLWRSLLAALLLGAASLAGAVDIKVMSAGAVEPGLVPLAQAFERDTGHAVRITFSTAPVLKQRLAAGESADVLIAPPAVVDEAVAAGQALPDERRMLGKVGVGVVTRNDAPTPDIASTEALKASLLAADSLVYNQASTGLYFEKLVERLGLADALRARTVRYPDGAAVLEHLARGKGREFGVAAITEIVAYAPKGVRLVGPLPAAVQNTTSYTATVLRNAPAPDAARAFIAYLTTASAKARFAAAGIE